MAPVLQLGLGLGREVLLDKSGEKKTDGSSHIYIDRMYGRRSHLGLAAEKIDAWIFGKSSLPPSPPRLHLWEEEMEITQRPIFALEKWQKGVAPNLHYCKQERAAFVQMIRAVAKAEPEGTKRGSPAATAVATQEEELHVCSRMRDKGGWEVLKSLTVVFMWLPRYASHNI